MEGALQGVGATQASNLGRGEGESGAPRLAPAPEREGEHLEPKHRHEVGLNRLDVVRVCWTHEAELRRAQICYAGAKSGQPEHRKRFITSGRRSGRLDAPSRAPSGQHTGRTSPASSGGGDLAQERPRVGEMRQGRESGFDRGSKGSRG
jgi:hypothetical protein